MADVELIKKEITYHPDFPRKGIVFLDIFPILRNPTAFETLLTHLEHHITSNTIGLSESKKIDVVVALDARGFLIGPILALRLGAAFVPVRKGGKLPGKCEQAAYDKEYGKDIFEIQEDSIKPGQNVIVFDDLLATGGSAKAAGELISKLGGNTLEYIFMVELPFLNGAHKLDAPVYSVIQHND